jgi:hypothetical protein
MIQGGAALGGRARMPAVAAPLVHIGYHKTGTSWLQKHLFQSPSLAWTGKRRDAAVNQLVLARPLEFEAERVRAAFAPELENAAAKGALPVVSLERLSGHPFSGGYDSKQLADRIHAVFPDARILIVIREQRSILVSTYKQYVSAGGSSPLRTFLEPPRHQRLRIPGFDFRHFEYHHLLAYYRSLFGASHVRVAAYEQLAGDPEAFVAGIVRFAGARPPGPLPLTKRQNAARAATEITLQRCLNHLFERGDLNLAPVIAAAPLARLGRTLAPVAAGLLPAALQQRADARLRARVAALVGDRYASSNRETAGLTGLDLRSYGYSV